MDYAFIYPECISNRFEIGHCISMTVLNVCKEYRHGKTAS